MQRFCVTTVVKNTCTATCINTLPAMENRRARHPRGVPASAEHRGEVGWTRGRAHEGVLGVQRSQKMVDSVLVWNLVTGLRYHAVQPRTRVTGRAAVLLPERS